MQRFPILGGIALPWNKTAHLSRGVAEVFMPGSLRPATPGRLAVYAYSHQPTHLDVLGSAEAWPTSEGLWFQMREPRAVAGTYEMFRTLARLDRAGFYPSRLSVSVGGLQILRTADRHGPGERVVYDAVCDHVAIGVEGPAYHTAWCGIIDRPKAPPPPPRPASRPSTPAPASEREFQALLREIGQAALSAGCPPGARRAVCGNFCA